MLVMKIPVLGRLSDHFVLGWERNGGCASRTVAGISALAPASFTQNMGKAPGLNLALAMSHGEIIVTLDVDSMLDERAIEWAVWHFITFPRVGAVTGNPRVRNRSTLLAKIQTAEYSSVIGLIKRVQRLMGKVMTVSGVVAAWRRSAIIHVGLWNTVAITDDIEMTWKLETYFWDIRYEPNMICWMLGHRLSHLLIFVPPWLRATFFGLEWRHCSYYLSLSAFRQPMD